MEWLEKIRRNVYLNAAAVAVAVRRLKIDAEYSNSGRRDALLFMIYLAAANGVITCGELDVMSNVLEETITMERVNEIVADRDYVSYMHCIPASLQIHVNMDNVIVWNRMEHTIIDMPTEFIELYKAIGEAVICADGEASKEAKERLRYFIHNLGEYVNETSERRHKYGLIDYDALMA